MFLHLGGDFNVFVKDIVLIIDVETVKQSPDSEKFFLDLSDNSEIIKITKQDPKSVIITQSLKNKSNLKTKPIVYYSPISSLTLLKRAGFINSACLEMEVI